MAARRRRLIDELAHRFPELDDAGAAIAGGSVVVAGRIVTNPMSLVAAGDAVSVRRTTPLRGSAKVAAALDAFEVGVAGRVALDVGAAAGGFTTVLLERGARRVYAVDAGHGQLVGSLRQDERVVNLEGTNLGDLSRGLVPDTIELVTIDVSYLSLAAAVPQLHAIELAPGCDLVALVKPMFELGLATAPTDAVTGDAAVARASSAIANAGWDVVAAMPSPVTGAKGAVEALLHARRSRSGGG